MDVFWACLGGAILDGMGWEETDGMIPHTYAWTCDDGLDTTDRKGRHILVTYMPRQGRLMGWDIVGVFSGDLHFIGTQQYQPTTWPYDDTT